MLTSRLLFFFMPASFELVLENLEALDLEFGFESSADSEIRKH